MRRFSSGHYQEKIDLELNLKTDTIKKLKSKAKKQGVSYKDLAVSVLQRFANS